MNMVIPNEGKIYWLQRALRGTGGSDEMIFVQMYSNDLTPDDNSVFDSFTLAIFPGGGAIEVDPASWPTPTIVADVAESTQPVAPAWTSGGGSPQTCYGWVAYTADSHVAVAAQRFETARVMSPGATESLAPFKMKLKSFA